MSRVSAIIRGSVEVLVLVARLKTGRLTITKVTGPVTITVPSAEAIEMTADSQKAIKVIHNGQILILKNGKAYNTLGAVVDDIR